MFQRKSATVLSMVLHLTSVSFASFTKA